MIQLRDYQIQAEQDLRAAYRAGARAPLLVLPTGGGKTVLFVDIARRAAERGTQVLILAHRQELIAQISHALDDAEVSHGLVVSGATRGGDGVQVASVQTMVRRLERISWSPGLVVVDECFPAGTLIDDRRIEDICIGDRVRSFDTVGRIVSSRVVSKFRRKTSVLVRVWLANGICVVSTYNHPFLTTNGWKNAGLLTKNSDVYIDPMYGMRADNPVQISKCMGFVEEGGKNLLLGRMPGQVGIQKIGGDYGSHEQEVCVTKNEGKKPNAPQRQQGEDGCHLKENQACTNTARRQRPMSAGTTIVDASCAGIWMVDGGCYPDEGQKRAWVPDMLQGRHREQELEDSDRDRRTIAFPFGEEETRREKGLALGITRVECVEIFQQGRDREFEQLCPGGDVYNLEVENTHTYFANGVAVHNCHHAVGGNTWGKILGHYSGARLLGVTATPERLDGRGLGVQAGGFFDAMVVGPSVRDLVAAGHLSRPVVYAPATLPDLSRLRSRGGDYVSGELDALMAAPSITGDAVAHYRRLGHQEPAIAFCVSVARAEDAAQRFRAAGYQSASIDGTLSDRERRERILDLASGQLHVLTSCEIVSEGVDIPVVSVGIMLRPTMSMGLAKQQMGRVLRPSPGKTRALILDHAALTRTHGLPDDDQAWSLAGREKSRAGAAPSAPVTKQCTECYAVHRPAPSCPYCGFVYPIQGRDVEEKAGELVEVVPPTKEEIERRQAEARRERAQARSMQELVEMGRRRGYKNPAGWAYNVMRGRERAVAR